MMTHRTKFFNVTKSNTSQDKNADELYKNAKVIINMMVGIANLE